MSDNKQFKFVPPEQNALDNVKLHLFAASTEKGKNARFQVQFEKNNPRFKIYTNDSNDKTKENEYGSIYARMDIIAFNSVMDLIIQACDLKEPGKWIVENKNFVFPYGKRSEFPVVVSETYVGKDKDGLIWVCVVGKDRPKIKFEFKGDNYHIFKHGDGTDFSISERSIIHAKAWVNSVRNIVNNFSATKYTDPKVDTPASAPKSNNSPASQTPSQSSSSFDDDIPF